jgi:ribonuclease BN (tRNA processing enzyme)
MKIIIIGSGTCVPSQRRASPCVMVKTAQSAILCDTGPGTLRQLVLAGAQISDIDMIIYSHFHIDHTADFCPFIFTSKYGPDLVRSRDLTVMGPPGLMQWYEGLKRVHGQWIEPELYSINWVETAGEKHLFNGFSVESSPVKHTQASIAVRIENESGKAVVYSGDTDYCEEIIAISRNADKVLLECSCPEGHKVDGHLTPSLAGRIARESGCKSLVLTHLYPACDSHDLMAPLRQEYGGPCELACDLQTLSL